MIYVDKKGICSGYLCQRVQANMYCAPKGSITNQFTKTQINFPKHKSISQNTNQFPKTQINFPKHKSNFPKHKYVYQNTKQFLKTQTNFVETQISLPNTNQFLKTQTNFVETRNIIRDGDRKSWDARGPMI